MLRFLLSPFVILLTDYDAIVVACAHMFSTNMDPQTTIGLRNWAAGCAIQQHQFWLFERFVCDDHDMLSQGDEELWESRLD